MSNVDECKRIIRISHFNCRGMSSGQILDFMGSQHRDLDSASWRAAGSIRTLEFLTGSRVWPKLLENHELLGEVITLSDGNSARLGYIGKYKSEARIYMPAFVSPFMNQAIGPMELLSIYSVWDANENTTKEEIVEYLKGW